MKAISNEMFLKNDYLQDSCIYLFYLATKKKKAACKQAIQGTNGFKSFPRD